MTIIQTCGRGSKKTTFSYQGNVETGITIEFDSGDFEISANTIRTALDQFKGQTIRGGFSMTDPTEGGFGEYLAQQGHGLTPRHGSFLCAVLQNEGYIECDLDGNAVVMAFKSPKIDLLLNGRT